jgi:hypothetical protein
MHGERTLKFRENELIVAARDEPGVGCGSVEEGEGKAIFRV